MYEKDNKQIGFVQEQYINCKLGIEIPAILKVAAHEKWFGTQLKGVNPARESSFEGSKMIDKMGGGPLRLHAEKILHKICAYQKERNERIFGGGSLADATNLLLEELKDWLFNRLSASSCQDLKDEVARRITYLKNLEESDLFPAGSSEKHLASLLVEIKGILRDEVRIAIEKSLAEESAREEFQKLIEQSKQLLLHTLQYLYYVIRGGASDVCNLDDLRGRTTDQKMQKSLQTYSGNLLSRLANSQLIVEVFSNENTTKNSKVAHRITDQGSAKNKAQVSKATENPLKSANNLAMFNERVLNELTTSKAESGVHSSFLVDSKLLLTFIEIHGLVEALASFILVCQKFHKAAGDGGDIIIYGFANQSMKYFIQAYFPLVNSLFSKITLVNKITDVVYSTENTSKSPWVLCYRKANDFFSHMQTEKDICDVYAGKMLHKVEIGIDEVRQAEIKAQIEDSIVSAELFSQVMHDFFPKELNAPPIRLRSQPMLTRSHSESKSDSSVSHRPPIEKPMSAAKASQSMPKVEKADLAVKEASTESNVSKPTVFFSGNNAENNKQKAPHKGQKMNSKTQRKSSSDDDINFPPEAATYHDVLSQNRNDQNHTINGDSDLKRVVSIEQEINIQYVSNFFESFPQDEQVAFIDLYRISIGVQKKMGKVDMPLAKDKFFSLNRFNKPAENNFLQNFDDNKFFTKKVSLFCQEVRHIILDFEQKVMEYDKPYIREELWKQRHQELFCLKYLCVDAVKRSEDSHLALFISDLQFFSDEGFIFSRYDALKDSLQVLNKKRAIGKKETAPCFNTNVDKNLQIQKEEFRKEASKVDVLQEKLDKELARRDEELARDNARRDEQLAQRLADIESRIGNPVQQPSQSCTLF